MVGLSDKIYLSGLQFFAYHGVLPEEAVQGQPFIIDLELQTDLSQPAATDQVDNTVSYADVYETVKEIATGRRFNLIEGLAGAIVSELLTRYPPLSAVRVKVKKPHAPVGGLFHYMGVELYRTRDERA